MKPSIVTLWAFVLLLYGCNSQQTERDEAKAESLKFNVLFIVSDDLRTELGAYGYPHMKTPNIDRLAAEGRLFTQAHVQEAICNPSRMSFLTGLRPDVTKVYSNRDHFRSRLPEATTIPQHFKENGYRTQAIGKIFHGGMDDPFAWSLLPYKSKGPKYGPKTQAKVDSAKAVLAEAGKLQKRYLELDSAGLPIRQIREKGEEYHSISWEAPDVDPFYFSDGQNCQHAMQTLDTLANTGEPFFMAVGFSRPHTPYVAPASFFDLYPIDTLADEIRQVPSGAPDFAFPGHAELSSYSDVIDKWTIPDEQGRILRRAYRASVSYVDFLVGELMHKLKSTGLDQNTIVILIGDHGYHLGEQAIWTKQTNFDWGTLAPLIVKVPNQQSRGNASNTFVEFVDILPTLADLADLPAPSPTSGKSFAPVVIDENQVHKDYAFSQYPRKRDGVRAMGYTVRSKEWRYTQWVDRKSGAVLAEELYDMRSRSYEKENMVSNPEYQVDLDKHRELIQKYITDHKADS